MKLCCIWKSCRDHEVLILGDPSLLLWAFGTLLFFVFTASVTKSKLLLLSAQQSNQLRDESLGQRIEVWLGKPAGWEGGGLVSPKSSAPKFGLGASFNSSLQWQSFSRGSSWLTDWTQVSCLEGRFLHCRQILYQLSYKGSPLSLGIATSSTEPRDSWRLLLKLAPNPNFQPSLKASFFHRANKQRWRNRVKKVMSCCKYFLGLVKTLKGMC